MYICDRCGDLCEEDDLPTYTEDFGYDTGVGWRSCLQTFVDNCSCGGEYVEATKCCICDEYFYDEDGYGACENCLSENATFENALLIGEEETDAVEINGFLSRSFTREQIEEILKRELEQARNLHNTIIDKDAKGYCLEDASWFAEWVKEHQ